MLNGILTGGSWLVSSTHWTPQVTYEAGLFAMEDSGGWDRGHLVYLPYCSRWLYIYSTYIDASRCLLLQRRPHGRHPGGDGGPGHHPGGWLVTS